MASLLQRVAPRFRTNGRCSHRLSKPRDPLPVESSIGLASIGRAPIDKVQQMPLRSLQAESFPTERWRGPAVHAACSAQINRIPTLDMRQHTRLPEVCRCEPKMRCDQCLSGHLSREAFARKVVPERVNLAPDNRRDTLLRASTSVEGMRAAPWQSRPGEATGSSTVRHARTSANNVRRQIPVDCRARSCPRAPGCTIEPDLQRLDSRLHGRQGASSTPAAGRDSSAFHL